jgi:hypothetical protein
MGQGGIQALAILLYTLTLARDLASLYALSVLFGFGYGGVPSAACEKTIKRLYLVLSFQGASQ